MKELSIKEQKNIIAGASVGWIIAGIITGVTFLVGVLDGITRPFKCR